MSRYKKYKQIKSTLTAIAICVLFTLGLLLLLSAEGYHQPIERYIASECKSGTKVKITTITICPHTQEAANRLLLAKCHYTVSNDIVSTEWYDEFVLSKNGTCIGRAIDYQLPTASNK